MYVGQVNLVVEQLMKQLKKVGNVLRNCKVVLVLESGVIKLVFTGPGICIKWWEILVEVDGLTWTTYVTE